MNRTIIILLSLVLPSSSMLPAQPLRTNSGESPYYDLGGFHHEVSTESPRAQVWFDRGLAMCYGFNREEAIRCYERAMTADAGMAMAYWGVAYALGPNINNMQR